MIKPLKKRPDGTNKSAAHNAISTDFTFNKNTNRKYDFGKVKRTVSIRQSGGINIPVEVEEKISKNGMVLYPEFLEYIFQVEGIAKKLLLYIIFYELSPQNNTFNFNPQIIAGFNSYCKATTGKTYSASTVRQALRKQLVGRNLLLSGKRGEYILNPMVGGSSTYRIRRTLISDYSDLLLKKGKDPNQYFYPVFKK